MAAALAVTACGEDVDEGGMVFTTSRSPLPPSLPSLPPPPATSARTTTTGPAPPATPADPQPVTDAPDVARRLLAIAAEATVGDIVEREAADPDYVLADWAGVFPGLAFGGARVAATPTTVSVAPVSTLDPKDAAGPTNPFVIALAVLDTAGRCAGGRIIGYPTFDRFTPVDLSPERCTAAAVLASTTG